MTDVETLNVLATDENYYVRCRVAQHPNTPVETLKVLATDENSIIRYWVAKHPNTPIEILKVLATDNDYDVRWVVAKHPNTSVETLKVLATDENLCVRYCVAKHPNTPVETLKVLATDKDYDVRYCVAKNPNTPLEIHKLISAYEFNDIRWRPYQMGYNASKEDCKVEEGEMIKRNLKTSLQELSNGDVRPMDDVIDRLLEKYKSQKLWNMLRNELGYSIDCCDEIVDLVERWLPKEQSAEGSQNTFAIDATEGFNHCLNKIKGTLR